MNSKVFLIVVALSTTVSPSGRHFGPPSVTQTLQRQVNPDDRNYGAALQRYAAGTLAETLENLYFWTTVTSLAAATTLSLFALQLMRQRTGRELISSKLLAWYHNELAYSRNAAPGDNRAMKDTETCFGSASPTAKSEPLQTDSQAAMTVSPTADILLELSRLRQQITAQESTEKILRNQINSLTKRLHEEKTRNKSIKAE